jgi:hypothetical protein
MTSIKTILELFHERGFGVLLLFFAAPMALPIPVPPGINVLLASPLLLLTAQQAMGRHTIWMPKKIKNKNMSTKKLKNVMGETAKWLAKIEILIKPRLGFITQGAASKIVGTLGFIMALSVCVPVPLTNTVPSFGIALMAIGVSMRDGAAVIAGAIIGIAWVTMLAGCIIIFGPEAFDIIKNTIRSSL